jgi:hypothetical protein
LNPILSEIYLVYFSLPLAWLPHIA